MVMKRATTIGPRIRPAAPKSVRPPSVPTSTSRSGICVSLPTSAGRRTLSIVPTTAAHQIVSPIAAPVRSTISR
jgi:hypothetical protein